MIRNIPSADKLVPILDAGRQIRIQQRSRDPKKISKEKLEKSRQKVKTNSAHVLDKKSKLQKKAKISMKAAKAKKNKYNVR